MMGGVLFMCQRHVLEALVAHDSGVRCGHALMLHVCLFSFARWWSLLLLAFFALLA